MDNGQNSDTYMMDGSLVLHVDENETMRHPNDDLARRLKNRERQRRYRARKRHQADLKKSSIVNQSNSLHHQQMPTELLSVPVQVDISVNLSSPDCLTLTRVHCQRDWKKDARRAHIHNKQELGSIDTTTHGESTSPSLDNNAAQRLQFSRRHWKEEARNKKSSE